MFLSLCSFVYSEPSSPSVLSVFIYVSDILLIINNAICKNYFFLSLCLFVCAINVCNQFVQSSFAFTVLQSLFVQSMFAIIFCNLCLQSICAINVCNHFLQSSFAITIMQSTCAITLRNQCCAINLCNPFAQSMFAILFCNQCLQSICAINVCNQCVHSMFAIKVCNHFVQSICAIKFCNHYYAINLCN